MFNNTELRNILVLISKAPIVGEQAGTVAMLQKKINDLLTTSKEVDKAVEKMSEVTGTNA